MASATVGVLRVLLTANSAEFDAALKRASGQAQLWSKDLQNIGRQATQVGTALTKTLTLPILALGVGSVKAAMDFESSFANVGKTVDGVSDKAGKLTERGTALANVFRQMAKEIPKTTDELNAIAAIGGQMGVPIEQLEHFTRNVAALSVAVDGISAEEAAAALAQIGNATGTGTTNIQEMASALAHLGNKSNATEADILEFTKRLVGAGHSAGMTVPEVMAIGTAMANVGINAEAGGTAMSTVISKISKAVSTGSQDLKDFAEVAGKSAEEFTAIWKRSSAEGIDLFVQGLSTMKARGVDLNLTMGELGTEGVRVASTLKLLAGAGDGVSKSIKLANEGYQDGNKHLEEAAKKYATTANQMKLFWNQVNDIGITIGNALLPALNAGLSLLSKLLPIVDGIAKAFGALPDPLQGVIGGLALILAATGPVIWAFGHLTTSASVLIGAFGKKGIAARLLAVAFGQTSVAATTTATSITAAGTSASTAAVGFGTLTAAIGTAMFWSGIGIAIAGIAFGVYKVVGAIKEASKALSEGRFWEFFTAKDKDNWLRSALGMDTGKVEAPPPSSKPMKDVHLAVAPALTAAGKGADTLTDKLNKLSAQVKAADKEIAGLSATTRDQLTKAFKSGAFSIEELKKETGLSEVVLERFKKQLQEGTKAHNEAAKAAEKHTAWIDNFKDSARRLETQLQMAEKAGVPMTIMLEEFGSEIERVTNRAPLLGEAVAAATQRAADAMRKNSLTVLLRKEAEEAAERGKKTFEQNLDQLEKWIKARNDIVVKGMGAESNALTSYLVERERRTLSTIDFEIAQLERQRDAEIAALDKSAEGHDRTATLIRDTFALRMADVRANHQRELDQMAAQADTWGNRLEGIFESLPILLERAFTGGGGGFAGFGKSLLGGLAETFTGKGVTDLLHGLANKFSHVLGTGMMTSLAKIIPGIGGFIASLVGPMIDKIVGLFGSKGRDMVKEFAESFGGFDALQAKLAGLGAEGAALWKTLTQGVGRNNPQQAQAAIDAITAALERAEGKTAAFNSALGGLLGQIQSLGTGLPDSLKEYLRELERGGRLTQENIDLLNELAGQGEADWKKIQEAVGRYGGDISKLGGTFQAQRLHESWQQIIDDVDIFERGGMGAVAILDLTKGKIIEVAQQSVRFGTEIPENMRPWIEKLILSGELVDENGQKITDIGKLKFGETLQTSLQLLTDEIKKLILAFQGVPAEAGKAARGIERELSSVRVPPIKVAIQYEDAGYTPTGRSAETASTGGYVTPWGIQYRKLGGIIDRIASWPRRGTDTVRAMLTPGEFVMNPMATSVIGPSQLQDWNHGIGLKASSTLAQTGISDGGMSRGQLQVSVPITIHAIDSRGIREFVASREFGDSFEQAVRNSVNRLRPVLMGAV
jgi:TP901 family phage tail tape measure protein